MSALDIEVLASEWDRAWARTIPPVIIRNEAHTLETMLLGLDLLALGPSNAKGRQPRQPKRPRLHPTKGYRGAHKRFRGGSR